MTRHATTTGTGSAVPDRIVRSVLAPLSESLDAVDLWLSIQVNLSTSGR